MVVCLEDIITSDLISEIGKLKPQTIVFKDKSFVDENLKIKTIEELKKYGIDKEKIKTI